MSKKGENIRKRKDGRWEARYRKGVKENGDIIYASVYAKTYREVKEKLRNAIIESTVTKAPIQHHPMLFSELLARWQASNSIRLKGGTKARYDNLIRIHILPQLGNIPVSELSASTINEYLNEKASHGRRDGKGGLSPSYIRSISLIISSALSFGTDEDLCAPLRGKISKPSPHKDELVVLSLDKQRILEDNIRAKMSPTHIGIMISLYTGLRIGEVCALSWNDVDLTNKVISVRHTVSRIKSSNDMCKTELVLDTPKTPSSKRVIPIPSQLYGLLFVYREESTSAFVVSTESTFISPRTYEYRYHSILNDCGIESINYHALRHTFATRCIEAGVDVKSLSEILGHANAAITLNTYVHSSIEMKKAQLEKLSSLPA